MNSKSTLKKFFIGSIAASALVISSLAFAGAANAADISSNPQTIRVCTPETFGSPYCGFIRDN